MLQQGIFYIERDAWGLARFDKIQEQPRVLVMFGNDDNGCDDEPDEVPPDDTPPDDGDDDDDDIGSDGIDEPAAEEKKSRPKKTGAIKGIPPELIKVDPTGKLVIDLTNLNLSDDDVRVEMAPPKKPKKPASPHKKVNRKVNNTTSRKTKRDYGGK
jgi:hypothetical protein